MQFIHGPHDGAIPFAPARCRGAFDHPFNFLRCDAVALGNFDVRPPLKGCLGKPGNPQYRNSLSRMSFGSLTGISGRLPCELCKALRADQNLQSSLVLSGFAHTVHDHHADFVQQFLLPRGSSSGGNAGRRGGRPRMYASRFRISAAES